MLLMLLVILFFVLLLLFRIWVEIRVLQPLELRLLGCGFGVGIGLRYATDKNHSQKGIREGYIQGYAHRYLDIVFFLIVLGVSGIIRHSLQSLGRCLQVSTPFRILLLLLWQLLQLMLHIEFA